MFEMCLKVSLFFSLWTEGILYFIFISSWHSFNNLILKLPKWLLPTTVENIITPMSFCLLMET